MTSQRLLSTAEVADMLQIPVASLHTQRYRGEHPGVLGFRVGRHVRFDPQDLERWLEQQKRSGPESVDQQNHPSSRPVADSGAKPRQEKYPSKVSDGPS
jgi:hypothetical protein